MDPENQNPTPNTPYNPERVVSKVEPGIEGHPPVPEILPTGINTKQIPVTPVVSPPAVVNEVSKPKNKPLIFLAVLLILASLGSLGYWAYKNYFSSQSSPSPSPIITPDPNVGQFCGGITGKTCPEGYTCKYNGSYPDASGVCTKLNEKLLFGLPGLFK